VGGTDLPAAALDLAPDDVRRVVDVKVVVADFFILDPSKNVDFALYFARRVEPATSGNVARRLELLPGPFLALQAEGGVSWGGGLGWVGARRKQQPPPCGAKLSV